MSDVLDVLIVDGPNWWNMCRALGNPFLPCDPKFLSQLEGRLTQMLGREVRFSERLWVSKRVNRHRGNTRWLTNTVFPSLKGAGWQLCFPPPNISDEKPDDEHVKWLLWEYAERLPEGSLLGLGSGDGDFAETIRDIKSAYPCLELAVITTSYGPFHANPSLRELSEKLPGVHFVDLLPSLPCLIYLLTGVRKSSYNTGQHLELQRY
jgi:hypothetical protein